MKIYCVACKSDVDCRLTDGSEIYPHRPDLANLPFWRHDICGNYVGCHHKTSEPTRPKGSIPTEEARKARAMVHRAIDPLWQQGNIRRKDLYAKLSKHIGRTYHTANIETYNEAYDIINFSKKIVEG